MNRIGMIFKDIGNYITGLTKIDWIVLASVAGAGFGLAFFLFTVGIIVVKSVS